MERYQKLIEDNMKLVYFLVRKHYPTFIYDEDVIQVGMVGLCEAAKRWDEEKGTFSTYASYCILNAIRNELKLRQKHTENLSLDAPLRDSEGGRDTVSDLIVGDEDVDFVDYKSFYDNLKPNQQKIIEYRRKGLTTYEIAEKLGCSYQNVSLALRRMKNIWRKHYGH